MKKENKGQSVTESTSESQSVLVSTPEMEFETVKPEHIVMRKTGFMDSFDKACDKFVNSSAKEIHDKIIDTILYTEFTAPLRPIMKTAKEIDEKITKAALNAELPTN